MVDRGSWIWVGAALGALFMSIRHGTDVGNLAGALSAPPVRMDGEFDPWSAEWSKVPATRRVLTGLPSPELREMVVRSILRKDRLDLLVEWTDPSMDMSFSGAYDRAVVKGGEPAAQESALLRDEITLRISNSQRVIGNAQWRSQWQRDENLHASTAARREFLYPYVDYYPVETDGAYAARFSENTNSVWDSRGACRWVHTGSRSVYAKDSEAKLGGMGEWRDGKWRVLFQIPTKELGEGPLLIHAMVLDGGLAETHRESARALPFEVPVPSGYGGRP